MNKRFGWLLVVFLMLAVLPAWAVFCHQCGKKAPDSAKFCAGCGAALQAAAPAPTPATAKPAKPAEPADPKAGIDTVKAVPLVAAKETGLFRTKTDLYVYERRGDEHNVLKKNFLFKPKRYKIHANTNILIKETVGDTCLVESVPETGVKALKGWVMQDELVLRTNWTKP